MSLSRLLKVVTALACIVASPAHAVVIDSIEFVGNNKTIPSTMLQEMGFRVGDDVNDERIEKSRQAIMDLGLFKSVTTDVAQTDTGNTLTITVDEKHFWFVLPRLSRSGDGDVSYGASMRFHNVAGRNQTLIFGAKRTETSDSKLSAKDEIGLRYTNPRLMGTSLELRTDVNYARSEIDEVRGDLEGDYGRKVALARVGVSRWLKPGPSKGWRVGVEATLRDYEHTYLSGDPGLYFDATTFSLAGLVEYIDVHDKLYSREGKHYGYELMGASKRFASDASFTRHAVFYRRYMPVGSTEHTNLNVQIRAGAANRTVFGDPAYSLGGSSSLRGFERDSVEGDAFLLANVEYLRPLFGKQNLRGVLFADVGTAWPSLDEAKLSGFKYSAGFGLRWRFESFVRTELRIDFAHGFNDGVNKVYASTKATF